MSADKPYPAYLIVKIKFNYQPVVVAFYVKNNSMIL